MPQNIFTSQLLDVVVAKKEHEEFEEAQGLFFILDYVPNDFKKMMNEIEPANLTEPHVVIIVYNLLCAFNFIHSAGIMHRDIKPGNLLIDQNCQIKLCDFGQARCTLMFPKTKVSSDQIMSLGDESADSK